MKAKDIKDFLYHVRHPSAPTQNLWIDYRIIEALEKELKEKEYQEKITESMKQERDNERQTNDT